MTVSPRNSPHNQHPSAFFWVQTPILIAVVLLAFPLAYSAPDCSSNPSLFAKEKLQASGGGLFKDLTLAGNCCPSNDDCINDLNQCTSENSIKIVKDSLSSESPQPLIQNICLGGVWWSGDNSDET